MENKEIRKNLKHGYLFLSIIVLVIFATSLSIEIYLKGGFKFNFSSSNTDNSNIEELVDTNATDNSGIFLEFQNITEGFKTKESKIKIVAKTDLGNKAWINSKEITVNPEGLFESEIELIVGSNEIVIEAENPSKQKSLKKVVVIRETDPIPTEKPKEEPKVEKPVVNTPIPKVEPTPTIKPNPEPQPTPTITALKLNCSITNTQPKVDQTVSLDCIVKDQNSNLINGANGTASINWQSGVQTISFPNSQNGSMKISFVVPANNKGTISGSVRISKDGLTVTSNFSIIVQ